MTGYFIYLLNATVCGVRLTTISKPDVSLVELLGYSLMMGIILGLMESMEVMNWVIKRMSL